MSRKEIIIKTSNEEEMLKIRDSIYNQLVWNKDYIESNIILNGSDDRRDGTENEIHLIFTDDCKKEIPAITLFEKDETNWMENLVVAEECEQFDEKCIVCILTLKNGYKVSGTYVHTGNGFIDNAYGEQVAREQALSKIYELEKYLQQQREYEKNTLEEIKEKLNEAHSKAFENDNAEEEKKPYSEMSYAEFCTAIDEDDNLSLLFENKDEEWQVWRDNKSNKFFYIESGINDASDFYEIVPVARLYYDDVDCVSESHDIDTLIDMFDCDLCGEETLGDSLMIWWFKRLEVKADDISYVELVDIHPREENKNE